MVLGFGMFCLSIVGVSLISLPRGLKNRMTDGWCSKGSCGCDGENRICCLHPELGEQREFSFTYGHVVPLLNSACCFFRVLDMVKHPQGEIGDVHSGKLVFGEIDVERGFFRGMCSYTLRLCSAVKPHDCLNCAKSKLVV
jgi:hypothetical protein